MGRTIVDIYVINLDRSEDRLRQFRQINSHLAGIHRFSAVDGRTVDRRELIESNTIAADLPYTDGAIGCAMSHIFFWEAAMTQRAAITVCEDDAIFHGRFLEQAPQLISTVAPDWDLVMWGWNFDSILSFDLMPGVSPCVATFNQDHLRSATAEFQRQVIKPTLFRLFRAFGTVSYSISPAGAKKLLERALPLRPLNVDFPMVNPAFPNNGIDIVMNAAYPALNAYVSFPPLVVTANDHGVSTVLSKR